MATASTAAQYIREHKLRITALSTLLVAIFSAAYIAIYFGYIDEQRRQNVNQIEREMGALLVDRINLRIEELKSPVNRLATRPDTLALVTSDSLSQQLWLDDQALNYSSVLQFAMIGERDDLNNHKRLGKLSYTDIDLFNRARATNQPQIEAVKINNEWIIRYIVPIADNENNSALLVANLSPNYLAAAVSALPASITSAAILQEHNGKLQPFINKSSDVKGENVGNLAETNWKVRYSTAASIMIPAAPMTTLAWLLLALSLGTNGALLWMFWPIVGQTYTAKNNTSSNTTSIDENDDTGESVVEPSASIADITALTSKKSDDNTAVHDSDGDTDDLDSVFDLDIDELDEAAPEAELVEHNIDARIFRDYDIRGIADTQLTDEACLTIGQAIGTLVQEKGGESLYVGQDDRTSSDRIKRWLTEGILLTGCDVIDIGSVHTGQLYFSACTGNTPHAIMVTASHNPAEYNGVKVVIDGRARGGEIIQELLSLCNSHQFKSGQGDRHNEDFNARYIGHIASDIAILDPLKVVVDCGNAVAGRIAVELFESLGCEAIGINCDIDGMFPAHDPNPSDPANMKQLQEAVVKEQADLGIALDGDADRVMAVTRNGEIVEPDQLIALLATDLLSRQPSATIVYDVKCSQLVAQTIKAEGGVPMMAKSGHSNIKQAMVEHDAALAGEYSGHIFFQERWFGFDDGLYAAARLIEFISLDGRSLDELVADLPKPHASPEFRVDVGEFDKNELMRKIMRALKELEGDRELVDGLIIRQRHAWGLVRPSNTENALTFRFEGNNEDRLNSFTEKYRSALDAAELEVELPF